ncbi:MAG TPA: cytochrome P450 [Pyrinomonadaceae bacterium]|nr:cytochrome P450 [Pyrinomonadaceae bacterium]
MRLPPGPLLPSPLQTLGWCLKPYELIRFCSRRYGEPFTINFVGNRTYVIVNHPDVVRDTFSGFGSPDHVAVGNEELRPMFGDNSVFLLTGEKHRRHRQLISELFQRKSLPCYGPRISEIADRLGGMTTRGESIPVIQFVRRMGISLIVSVVFGLREGPRFAAVHDAVERLITIVNGPLVFFALLQRDLGKWSPGGRVWRAREALIKIIDSEIAERRRQRLPSPNLLDTLVEASEKGEAYLSDDEIRDEIITVLLAGHDPTTAATCWALYLIHKNPAVEERLRAELVSSSSDPGETAALPYLEAVSLETLRLYPIVPAVERVLRVPARVCDYELPAGMRVTPCMYLTHRRPEIYPEPDSFKPERFVNRQYSPFEFLPFGGGTRRCVGAHFAPYQIKLVLASLLRRFRFELVNNGPIHSVQKGATIMPSARLTLQVVGIENGHG